jgi:hypothetical protein
MKAYQTLALLVIASLFACGGPSVPIARAPQIKAQQREDGTIIDDKALCKGLKDKNGQLLKDTDIEVSETAGPGAVQPNVRRVFRVFGKGPRARKILICREVDTNLDGFKDVVRTYDSEGQSKEERADTNYDGRIDTWNLFAKGRLAEVRLDRNHDTRPDEWKIYVSGKLSRIKRDSDFNGEPDIWEMYRNGRLERMGIDKTADRRVDQWLYDTEWRRELKVARERKLKDNERKRKAKEEKLRKAAEKTATESLDE